jgi:hypothetical protein
MIRWCAANNLVVNFDKTNLMKFTTKNSSHSALYVGYKEKLIQETVYTKLLGLQIGNHINWKNQIKQFTSGACYAARLTDHISNINTFQSIYYAYSHSIIKYGTISQGNSSNSGKIFTLQKKISRIMAGAQHITSCSSLLKQLLIPPVPCQHILSLTNFIINNWEIFQRNSPIPNINTKNKHHLHRPNSNLSGFQESTLYAGIKISTVSHPV